MIEHLVRHRNVRTQFRFAGEAKRALAERDDVVLAKSHRGLHVLARDERPLVPLLDALRSVYGSTLTIDRAPGGDPVFEVRIGIEKRYLPQVRAALQRRRANPSEEYLGMHYCVLRFQSGPASLLGLPAELARLTAGRLHHEIILRGYE